MKHSANKTFRGWLTVYWQPFFYGGITRLPFIYFVIHLRSTFRMSWTEIGLAVGCYQAMRVVTNVATIFAPRVAHLLGTMASLTGSIMVVSADPAQRMKIIVGTIMAGFAETMAAQQTYVKEIFGSDMEALEHKLKLQYAVIMVAVTLSFALGGYLYQHFNVQGVAWMGLIMSACELVSVLAFFSLEILDKHGSKVSKTIEDEIQNQTDEEIFESDSEMDQDDDDDDSFGSFECDVEDGAPITLGKGVFWSPDIKEKRAPPATTPDKTMRNGDNSMSSVDKVKIIVTESPKFRNKKKDPLKTAVLQALNSFAEAGMGANYLSYALCITFGMEAITIGYNLAVSPIYIQEVFSQETALIGSLLACGAGFGTALSIATTLTQKGQDTLESWLPSPVGFLFSMFSISFAVIVAAVPVFPVHIIGLILLMGFNDLAALLLNEMQGAITSTKAYKKVGPLGQVIRRSGNVVTAITGPILYGILPQLPYLVAGGVTFIWTCILTMVIRHRSRSIDQQLDVSVHPQPVTDLVRSYSFAQREVLARQEKRGSILINAI